NQTIYWVDIPNHLIYRYALENENLEVFDVGLPVGALGLRESGGIVAATKRGFAFWDFLSEDLVFLVDPEEDKPETRFNDAAVDRCGRFWAGTMSDSDPHGSHGSLYRLDPDGSVARMDTGFTVSNGIGWSPDDKIMYFTDTMRSVIYAYDFDIAAGTLENRRSFVTVPDGEGFPDGLTVDSEGFVWSAIALGYKINRYDPDGILEREIQVPTAFVSSCTFGGPGMDDLYITTGWEPLNDDEKVSQPFAGDLFKVSTGIKGLEEPKFSG
ncbi:MAG: SMP-30/gluconolactonase/LRE family protein, partial [Anaerolineales bacterium]|nr:SMP-30/gluconolactonase/LRE family protein [Anaerolineales bacterium]